MPTGWESAGLREPRSTFEVVVVRQHPHAGGASPGGSGGNLEPDEEGRLGNLNSVWEHAVFFESAGAGTVPANKLASAVSYGARIAAGALGAPEAVARWLRALDTQQQQEQQEEHEPSFAPAYLAFAVAHRAFAGRAVRGDSGHSGDLQPDASLVIGWPSRTALASAIATEDRRRGGAAAALRSLLATHSEEIPLIAILGSEGGDEEPSPLRLRVSWHHRAAAASMKVTLEASPGSVELREDPASGGAPDALHGSGDVTSTSSSSWAVEAARAWARRAVQVVDDPAAPTMPGEEATTYDGVPTFEEIDGGGAARLWIPGSRARGLAMASCSVAGAGFYTQSGFCFQCEPGRYSTSLVSGYYGCTACSAGRAAWFQATSCGYCGAGAYQPGTGAASCSCAPAGRYVPGTGATTFLTCPAGKASTLCSSSCSDCGLGRYTGSSGLSGCSYCDTGTDTCFKARQFVPSIDTFSLAFSRRSLCHNGGVHLHSL